MNLEKIIGKRVIVRSGKSGVHFAVLDQYDSASRTAVLRKSRRLWKWSGAASCSELATAGVANPKSSKISPAVPMMIVEDVIEVLRCTRAARVNIRGCPVWSCHG